MIEFLLREPLLVPVVIFGGSILLYGITCFFVKGCPSKPEE